MNAFESIQKTHKIFSQGAPHMLLQKILFGNLHFVAVVVAVVIVVAVVVVFVPVVVAAVVIV